MPAAQPPAPMPDDASCPKCGVSLGKTVLAGLCPACLLWQGGLADSVVEGETHPFEPPSTAALAAHFPQLELLELIGQGGMGVVYKARQRDLDRLVALKILPAVLGQEPGFAERFSCEAKALAKLNHPGIVAIYEFGCADGLFYIVMEFVDGVNLCQSLAHGRISPREALAIVPEICDALQFAHDHGIVHRDIKPANIMLDRRGRVKVADFGLAKLVAEPQTMAAETPAPAAAISLTAVGRRMGTPGYMAPEQSDHPSEVDNRADIYALGVVFYQMLTGELPQASITPPSRKVVVDVRLDEIVLRTLEKLPEMRYQQVSQVKEAVETISRTSAAAVPPDVSSALSQVAASPAASARPTGWSRVAYFSMATAAVAGMVVWWAASGDADLLGHGRPSLDRGLEKVLIHPEATAVGENGPAEMHLAHIATKNRETGALEVRAADGAALRLLAISNAEKPNAWWRPDGNAVTGEDSAITIRGEPPSREPTAVQDHFFLWDNRDCPRGGSPIGQGTFEPDGSIGYVSSVDLNGDLLMGVWAVKMTFPSGTRTVTHRVQIGLERPLTICTLDPHRLHYVRTPFPGAPTFDSWQDPVESVDGVRIGMIILDDPLFWKQIIALDKNGVEYAPRSGGSKRVGGYAILDYSSFEPDELNEHSPVSVEPPSKLTLAEVREFRAQVQPLFEAEFQNIMLHPGEPVPAAIPK